MTDTREFYDPHCPEGIHKAQRMMVFIFGFATLIPAFWAIIWFASQVAG